KIWVVERSGRVSFAEEPRLSGGVEVVMGQEKLERHDSAQSCVVGAIDDAHAPGAEGLAELEVRDGAPGETEGIRLAITLRQESSIDRCELRAGRTVGLQQRLERAM